MRKELFIVMVICFGLLTFIGCDGGNDSSVGNKETSGDIDTLTETSNETESDEFNNLKSIEIKLFWSDEYESSSILSSFFNFLIPSAHAVVSPEYQTHYRLNLDFNHDSKTITDTYKTFVGTDNSKMTTSIIIRDSSVYDQISQYMEDKYVCTGTYMEGDDLWAGPAQPQLSLVYSAATVPYIWLFEHPLSTEKDIVLCSEDFGDYLMSLINNRG